MNFTLFNSKEIFFFWRGKHICNDLARWIIYLLSVHSIIQFTQHRHFCFGQTTEMHYTDNERGAASSYLKHYHTHLIKSSFFLDFFIISVWWIIKGKYALCFFLSISSIVIFFFGKKDHLHSTMFVLYLFYLFF